jgi:ABC-type transporter MlaC component
MKKYLTLFSLLLLLAATAFAQDKAPKLVIESVDHDFGKIKEGVKVTHTFKLKNEGTANLMIEGVAPS